MLWSLALADFDMQAKKKTRKSEYEAKLTELKNECYEAWITLQDSNRMNEMLRDDLCAKSLCVDSLGMTRSSFADFLWYFSCGLTAAHHCQRSKLITIWKVQSLW